MYTLKIQNTHNGRVVEKSHKKVTTVCVMLDLLRPKRSLKKELALDIT